MQTTAQLTNPPQPPARNNNPTPATQPQTQTIHSSTESREPLAPNSHTATLHQQSGSRHERGRLRSWEQVQQNLVEICRLAQTHDSSASEGIRWNAENALLHLLVDTQTAEELEALDEHPQAHNPQGDAANAPPGSTAPPNKGDSTATAVAAAQKLRKLAPQQLFSASCDAGGCGDAPAATSRPHTAAGDPQSHPGQPSKTRRLALRASLVGERPTPWLGDAHRAGGQPTTRPRHRGTRRPRSSSERGEAESHRRRRLLAAHSGDV